MINKLAVVFSASAFALLTASAHGAMNKPAPLRENQASRAKVLIDAKLEKAELEALTAHLLRESGGFALDVDRKNLKPEDCETYANENAQKFPLELKEAYAKALIKMRDLGALTSEEFEDDKEANEINISLIQENVKAIRGICESKPASVEPDLDQIDKARSQGKGFGENLIIFQRVYEDGAEKVRNGVVDLNKCTLTDFEQEIVDLAQLRKDFGVNIEMQRNLGILTLAEKAVSLRILNGIADKVEKDMATVRNSCPKLEFNT